MAILDYMPISPYTKSPAEVKTLEASIIAGRTQNAFTETEDPG